MPPRAPSRPRAPPPAASAPAPAPPRRTPVYLFVPNLIGYARVLALLAALALSSRAGAFFWLYLLSYALDAADGPAARALGQTSRFGATLDMVTDRVSTAALLALLAGAAAARGARGAAAGALALLALDVGAHWFQTAAAGAARAASHKALPGEHALVAWYYRRANLFAVCLLAEAHLAAALLLSRAAADGAPLGVAALAWAPWPGAGPAAAAAAARVPRALLDALLPALPPPGAAHADAAAAWLAALTLPAYALKQVISLLQLASAAGRLVDVDEAERGAAEVGRGRGR